MSVLNINIFTKTKKVDLGSHLGRNTVLILFVTFGVKFNLMTVWYGLRDDIYIVRATQQILEMVNPERFINNEACLRLLSFLHGNGCTCS